MVPTSARTRGYAPLVVTLFTFFTFNPLVLAAQPPSSSADASSIPRAAAPPATICGVPVPAPAALPPAGSPPVVYALVPCFERQGGASMVDPQTYHSEQSVRKGLEKARELYGAIGHFEFTAYPEFGFRDLPDATPMTGAAAREIGGPPIVDVTMHMQEGGQYFVHRITFEGNTTTSDKVIRRELRLLEGGVFNTEALKYSVRRINQLGYFKPIDQERGNETVKVEKTPNETNQVDVTLRLEERNRNEVSFGGGVSGIDGFFLNFSYATTNFLGQGETLQVSAQRGARANIYQISMSEPYVFDRPISAGASIFSRKVDYLMNDGRVGYSEVRTGTTLTAGRPLGAFMHAFTSYAYEVIDSAISDDLDLSAGDPIFTSYLDAGRHIESRTSPSFVYNTVDHPFMPRKGMRLTGTYDVAGGMLGGTVEYIRPDAEAIVYIPNTRRTSLGVRVQAGWIKPYGATKELPYSDFVDATASPSPTNAEQSTGRTYRVVRGNNQPDEILEFDWHTGFALSVRLNNNATSDKVALDFPVTLTSATIKVQQASGGIVSPPTGGEAERYDSVTSQVSGNQFSGTNQDITMYFDIWYDLPSLKKEALITVSLGFADDNNKTFTKTVQVRVNP